MEPGPETKLAITRSSSDSVKLSSQPEISAGAMIGSVMSKNTRAGVAPRSCAASSRLRSRSREARADHHRHIGHAEGRMREDDGELAAAGGPAEDRSHRDEQQQQAEAGDDVGHHQRRRDQRAEQRLAAEAAEAGERHARRACPVTSAMRGADRRDAQRQHARVEHLRIGEELAVPFASRSRPTPSPACSR